jgi:hypothetical protein
VLALAAIFAGLFSRNARVEVRSMMAARDRWSAGIRATERYGTACRDAAGQWRIVN